MSYLVSGQKCVQVHWKVFVGNETNKRNIFFHLHKFVAQSKRTTVYTAYFAYKKNKSAGVISPAVQMTFCTAKWVTWTHRMSGHMWPPLLCKLNFCGSANGGHCVPVLSCSENFSHKVKESSNLCLCGCYLYTKCYEPPKALRCGQLVTFSSAGNVLTQIIFSKTYHFSTSNL